LPRRDGAYRHAQTHPSPGGTSELYDLPADPSELANLYGQPAHADVQRSLETRLLDWYVQTADVTPWTRTRAASRPPPRLLRNL
jgi:hypothetical protein